MQRSLNKPVKRIFIILSLIFILSIITFPAAVFAKSDVAPDNEQSNSYAIVIGISNYPGHGSIIDNPAGLDLFYANDDALLVQHVLLKNYGLKQSNITLLVNYAATRNNILKAINDIKAKASESDKVLFYYSGHSLLANEMGIPEESDTVGLIVRGDEDPQSLDFISDDELAAAFSDFNTNQIAFIFDSCSSGAFLEELVGPGRVVISATGPDANDVSGEYGRHYDVFGLGSLPELGWVNHGFFTYFFFSVGIQGNEAIDFDEDGIISLEEVFYSVAQPWCMYITSVASDMGFDQLNEIPDIIDLNGDFDL